MTRVRLLRAIRDRQYHRVVIESQRCKSSTGSPTGQSTADLGLCQQERAVGAGTRSNRVLIGAPFASPSPVLAVTHRAYPRPMPDSEKLVAARDAVLDGIVARLNGSPSPMEARVVLDLAEAYAWLVSQHQPHGGAAAAKST